MRKAATRVYADSSVFGGVFDSEFERASKEFFNGVRDGRFQLVISASVEDELAAGPIQVREFLEDMLAYADLTEVTEEAIALRRAYLSRGVVAEQYATDALHVAAATVAGCDVIVSWNFRHIVSFRRIPLYNATNALNGYNPIAIHSPLEVLEDEEEEV
jgi:predicted nucleic acid-binding protein